MQNEYQFSASTILLSTPRSCIQFLRTEFFTRVPSRARGDTNSTLHASIQQLHITAYGIILNAEITAYTNSDLGFG